jgi:hypothetical protein
MDRGETARVAPALVAHVLALVVALGLVLRQLAPTLAVGAMALLAFRALYGLSPIRPRWSLARFGASEAILGGVVVILIAAGVAAERIGP